MSEQAYTELLSAFCEHVQAANSADILEHGNLHIGEVAFTLVHDDSLGRDDILIYCDFGPLPQDDPAGEYLGLLHTNLQLYSGSIGSSFAVNPESGNVLLLAYQRLADATPERLASHLHPGRAGADVAAWRNRADATGGHQARSANGSAHALLIRNLHGRYIMVSITGGINWVKQQARDPHRYAVRAKKSWARPVLARSSAP